MNEIQTINVMIRSKKKRHQKKMLKKAALLVETKDLNKPAGDSKAERLHKAEQEIPQLDSLPVTFLLKTGKKYFPSANSVRYYYKSSEPEFYKNRDLLQETLIQESAQLSASLQQEFWEEVGAAIK
ncbi:hypothetical protein [Peribacillus kribbensis]|uniref:hypothetical protein n=1 Tax=Peribacillus kribbensis TaxID=356658 RepID=UPI00047ED4E1|nr:hypothetical protein [Peribacillus kribbensis]